MKAIVEGMQTKSEIINISVQPLDLYESIRQVVMAYTKIKGNQVQRNKKTGAFRIVCQDSGASSYEATEVVDEHPCQADIDTLMLLDGLYILLRDVQYNRPTKPSRYIKEPKYEQEQ